MSEPRQTDKKRMPGKSSELPGKSQQKLVARDAPQEIGGPEGLEPTRYGDWERKGRCIDF